MNSFTKRSPTQQKVRRLPIGPRESRQNPQRWRHALGLRPLGGGGGGHGQVQQKTEPSDSQLAQKWGNPSSSANPPQLYEGLPEPLATASIPYVTGSPEPGSSISKRTFVVLSRDGDISEGVTPQYNMSESIRNPFLRLLPSSSQSRSKQETDIFRSATPPPITTITNDKEVEDLVSKQAHTADDRYKILDGIDKLIRKRNPKVKVRVEFAVTLAGTCPDMCPEKERYMREVQRRLSSYECDSSQQDSVVDHHLAIKEYSRSSADQEEPLPHDLRPIQSLHLTFDYLLHNIISRMEDENESLSDLYFFIWDRTRAIRKDMTQQQLGSTEAVLLMEKCVRFHIYCSTRLCELDRHSFDPKLNDENLMKCLQSLEHMYADLLPLGIECPNEPEFRAYQILMHLNEGDIVREIQQKPDRILKSAPVAHALKIYVALNSMNSVAFFRLVEKSSFMVSCILHRYFFQIRTNALRRFLKTFSVKNAVAIPTMQVKRMLGFGSGNENINTFTFFCESHGFHHSNIGPVSITMRNRNEFEQPEFSLISREYALIESKLTSSVSEAINGGPLGQNPLDSHVPHSSFDENGYFKRDLLESLLPITKPSPSAHNLNVLQAQTLTASPPVTTGQKASSMISTSQKASSNVPPSTGQKASSTISTSDIRSRLGTRLGVATAQSADPAKFKPFGSSDSSSSSEPGTGFSFSNALASIRPVFGQNAASSTAASSFSFTSALANSGQLRSPFTSGGVPATSFSIRSSDSQREEAARIAQEKAEEKRKVGMEFRDELAQKILQEVVTKEVRQVATVVRQEVVVREAKEALKKSLVQQIYKQIEGEEIPRAILKSAKIEFVKAQQIASSCAKIESDLRNSVVLGEIKTVAQEVYNKLKAENDARLRKLDEICGRIRLRHWVLTWKSAVEEIQVARIRELERQQWNVENFPPIVAAQYPAVTILSQWSAGVLPLVDKPSRESNSFQLLERAMQVKRSFEKHLEEYSPSIIHHLAGPLLTKLSEVPQICAEWHPPVAINIVLASTSEFGPWDYLANWTWNSFLEDSVMLGNAGRSTAKYCAHRLTQDRNWFVTFQKCSDTDLEPSVDTKAIVLFNTSAPVYQKSQHFSTLDKLRPFVFRNPEIPVVIFNSSDLTEFELRSRLGLDTCEASSESDSDRGKVSQVIKGQHVVDNVPALVSGLQWIAESLIIGPPLDPPVILLPFSSFAKTMIREVFHKRLNGVTCPCHLYEGHNDVVKGLKVLIQNMDTLGVLKKWPGRATKLLIQKYCKSICFTHEAGMLGVVIKNLKELERQLLIDPPEDLIQKWHQGKVTGQAEVTERLKQEIVKVSEGHDISDNLRTRFNFVLSLLQKERSIPWRELLEACQECVLEKLSSVGSSAYQVCVDLRDIQNLATVKPSLSRCPSCSGGSGRKRCGFGLDQDLLTLMSSPKYKAVSKQSETTNLLQSMQTLLQEMKEEKEELESSFTEIQNSFVLDN